MSDYVRDYSKGKVYKIVVDTDEEYKPYVGSTIESLSRRMGGHRSKYKRWKKGGKRMTSFDLFDKFGVDKCKIILLEEYSCDSKMKLLMKEREWFDKIECCNLKRPLRTDEEVSIYNKIYYDLNKEQIAETTKIYQQDHKEQIAKKRKKRYETHKEEIAEKNKEKYQKNKEQISEKKKEKYECVCGDIIRKDSKTKHEKTQKHISFISQK